MTPPASLNTCDLLFWVIQLQAGKPNAAEKEFRKIMARVEVLARAMFKQFPRVGRFVDVDDVVQNSLIRLLAAFRDIRPTSTCHFYALANTLIRRELLDLTRHYYGPRGDGANQTAVVGEAAGEVPAAAPSADDARLEHLAALHEAVAALPVEQREAFGLTYYHGWPQGQISDLFGVSVRTVQRWLDAATATLRERVGEPGA